jgi:Domain of unknown function (DUF4160)
MPKIFEYLGLVFVIYTNEHLPIHVPAKYAEFETKFELEYDNGILSITKKKVRGKKHLPPAQMADAVDFITAFDRSIVEKWNRIMIYNQPVESEKITRRVR